MNFPTAVASGLLALTSLTAGTVANAATYSGELKACEAVWAYHEVDVTIDYTYDDPSADRAEWEHAYRKAWRAAGHADPSLRHAIRRYLWTDRGWKRVEYDCGFQQN